MNNARTPTGDSRGAANEMMIRYRCQAAPLTSLSGASHASDLRHTCWLPHAEHDTVVHMSGRLLKLKRSVSMPVAISRNVRGQRVMIMLM